MSTQTDREVIVLAEEFYRDYYHEEIGELAQNYPNDQQALWIDWHDLYRFDIDLADDYRDYPGQFQDDFEEALQRYDLPYDTELDNAHVRLYNLPDGNQFSVGGYRAENLGELLAVSGQVSKRTKVRLRPVKAAFECQRCGTMTCISQTGDEFQEPHECQGCERQGPFRISNQESEWEDHQLLRIQQPPEEVAGGQGAHVDVHVTDDLVEEVESGDRVIINGEMALKRPDDNKVAYEPYFNGHSLEVEKTDYEDIDIEEYEDAIESIADGEHGDPYDLLVNSLAPKIEGMDIIKEALILQLFGGIRVEYPDGSTDRGNSHVLLLGDPGTAKSSLLHAVNEIAPRATFASGKGASAAGMTAAAVSDDFGNAAWSVEAGALVIANEGIACVDEIDKVQENAVNSMHEALENERVNVNKAGINTTLPAQTALLAAGNPKYGRFDQYEPIADQIELDPALMSRFDLMIMLDDEPDAEQDPVVIGSILDSHQLAAAHTAGDDLSDEELQEIKPTIPQEALRAYIAKAKRDVYPRLTDEIKEAVKNWFTELRLANGDNEDTPIPVTFRKLEGVIRLMEASARVRLADEVAREDFERAKKLIMRSMEDVGMDPETGELDADIVETGNSKSQRDRIKNLKAIIDDLSDYDSGATKDEILELAMDLDMGKNQTLHELEKLEHKGEVYQPSNGEYRTS
jgi:replicative DNA helicase Mcm